MIFQSHHFDELLLFTMLRIISAIQRLDSRFLLRPNLESPYTMTPDLEKVKKFFKNIFFIFYAAWIFYKKARKSGIFYF